MRSISTIPYYQRTSTTRRNIPTAWNERTVRHASETPTRRYSERDDRPSWERNGETWELDDQLTTLNPSFWVRRAPATPQTQQP